MQDHTFKKVIVSDTATPGSNYAPEKIALFDELGQRVSIPSQASLNSHFLSFAPAPTGVAATDYANIQALLTAGGDVQLKSGTYAIGANTLKVGSYQALRGTASTWITSTGGVAIQTPTVGARTYGQKIEDLTLIGPGAGVAGSVGIDLEAMSLATLTRVFVETFETGIKFRSPSVSGGCVYNNTYGVSVNSCGIGFDVQSGANTTNIIAGSRANNCSTAGARITDANDVTVDAAFEGCAIGVDLVATSADYCILNRVRDCRMEGNTIHVRVGSLVKDTRITGNAFTGSGTFIEDRGLYTVVEDRRATNGRLPYVKRCAVHFTGATGNYAQTPDAAALDVTGDLFLSAEVALTDWTPSVSNILIDKTAASNVSYRLYISTAGKPGILWTPDGTTIIAKESTVATGTTDGAWKHIGVYLDVDNGASGNTVTFYTSVDGATWDVLGSPVVTAGVTSVYAGTAALTVGVSTDTASFPMTGRIASATVRSGGPTGSVVANWSADAQQGATRALDSTGKVWTMTGSAWCSTLY